MTNTPRVLIFGGSGALGSAVSRLLAERGARVVFTYRTGEEKAKALETELAGSKALHTDFAAVASIEAAVDEAAEFFGGLDAFVQCAGVAVKMECEGPGSRHRLPEITEEDYDHLMMVNVKSTFFAVRRLVPVMAGGGGGSIVFTGSMDSVKSVPSPVHYAGSKGALSAMTTALAKELGEVGIKVNTVAPGLMNGGMSQTLPDNLLDEYLKHCGLGRVARVEEIAEVIAWLALENTYVTGQTLLLDGAV